MFGVSLLEMRCPVCNHTQQIATRSLSLEPKLTACNHCKTLLVHQVSIQTKPNHLLLKIEFTPVNKDEQ